MSGGLVQHLRTWIVQSFKHIFTGISPPVINCNIILPSYLVSSNSSSFSGHVPKIQIDHITSFLGAFGSLHGPPQAVNAPEGFRIPYLSCKVCPHSLPLLWLHAVATPKYFLSPHSYLSASCQSLHLDLCPFFKMKPKARCHQQEFFLDFPQAHQVPLLTVPYFFVNYYFPLSQQYCVEFCL